MIVKWFLEVLSTLVTGVLDALPTLTLPPWFSSEITQTSPPTVGWRAYILGTQASGFGGWFPVEALATGAEFVLLAVTVALGVRLIRMAVSALTGGGGGAA